MNVPKQYQTKNWRVTNGPTSSGSGTETPNPTEL